jgi:hypothetical protein
MDKNKGAFRILYVVTVLLVKKNETKKNKIKSLWFAFLPCLQTYLVALGDICQSVPQDVLMQDEAYEIEAYEISAFVGQKCSDTGSFLVCIACGDCKPNQ